MSEDSDDLHSPRFTFGKGHPTTQRPKSRSRRNPRPTITGHVPDPVPTGSLIDGLRRSLKENPQAAQELHELRKHLR